MQKETPNHVYIRRPNREQENTIEAIRYRQPSDLGDIVLWIQQKTKDVYTGFFHPTSPLDSHKWLLIWETIGSTPPETDDCLVVVKPGDWIVRTSEYRLSIYTDKDFNKRYRRYYGGDL